MTLVITNSESGWLIYKVRKGTCTLLRIAPIKTRADAKLFAVFGMLLCEEVTRIHTVRHRANASFLRKR